MQKPRRIAASFFMSIALIFLLAGCSSGGPDSIPLEFETVKKGHVGFPFRDKVEGLFEFKVFRTKKEFKAFWKAAKERAITSEGPTSPAEIKIFGANELTHPPVDPDPWSENLEPIMPKVFWNRDMVVGVFLQAPTRGYQVKISSIKREASRVVVTVDWLANDTGDIVFNVPYEIVAVQKSDLPVIFEVNKKQPEG